MDPGGLIVMLIILVLFAGAMYVGYQKFVVEGDLLKTPTVEPSTPTEPPSSSDVPGVDSAKGRPNANAVYSGQAILYYGGGNTIPAGQAKTASVCYEASKARGINNWAWDRKDKLCFAYTDSNIFTAMNDNTNVEEKSRYVVGCTEPGVTVNRGCMDYTTGNLVKGITSTHAYTNKNNVSFEDCRKIVRDLGYDAFIYTTNRYQGTIPTQCYYYADAETLRGYTGDNNDISHMSGCTDPTKKVINACQ